MSACLYFTVMRSWVWPTVTIYYGDWDHQLCDNVLSWMLDNCHELKLNFQDKWQGKMVWYKKDKGDEQGGKMYLLLSIHCRDEGTSSTQTWLCNYIFVALASGSHLIINGKSEKFLLAEKTYNKSGKAFGLIGMGGQCSVECWHKWR